MITEYSYLPAVFIISGLWLFIVLYFLGGETNGMAHMVEDQQVRKAIRTLIARKEKRIEQLHAENKDVQKDEKPVRYRVYKEDVRCIDHSIMTLIELEHNLRLCGCPDEAYEK